MLCQLRTPYFRIWTVLHRHRIVIVSFIACTELLEGFGIEFAVKQFTITVVNRFGDTQTELKQGIYHSSPVKRVMIPKADGSQRPLGIPKVDVNLEKIQIFHTDSGYEFKNQILDETLDTFQINYSLSFNKSCMYTLSFSKAMHAHAVNVNSSMGITSCTYYMEQ